jgi:phosphoglycolate phosphatase
MRTKTIRLKEMLQLKEILSSHDHVIWDWNGTLLNDIDHCVETINSVLQAWDLPQVSREKYLDVFQFPVINYYKEIGFDFEKHSFEKVGTQFIQTYYSGVDSCNLVSGARELLLHIRENVKMQSVLSAAEQSHLNEMMEKFNIRKFFDNVFGINNIYAASKLERGQELIEMSGIARNKTILIGDTDHDLQVAQELGIEVILVSHGHQSFERLSAKHNRVFDLLASSILIAEN